MIDLIHGDCLEALFMMAPDSVDAIVTDPPYDLAFMGKKWDATGIAFNPDTWREALRVLKPGGHILAFGGTRTYHRMVVALEDAGFEIRDSLHWIYGSGFPKSLNVSKAIDDRLGAKREPTGEVKTRHGGGEHSEKIAQLDPAAVATPVTAPATPEALAFDGWGTALKPAHEPIVLARKPLVGTVAANVIEHRTGGINVDACRVGYGGKSLDEVHREAGSPGKHGTQRGVVYGEGLDKRNDAIEFNAAGRWPPNLLLSHAPECDEGGECAPWCPVTEMDRQSGSSVSTIGKPRGAAAGEGWGMTATGAEYGDSGGASRFFPIFRYCAKPARKERDAGCADLPARSGGEATEREDGSAGLNSPRAGAGRSGGAKNYHPTVKPVALMEWLCRLVTPPGGLVLDPFLGSGTTGVAAVRGGFRFVGIDREADYLEIARRRIAHAQEIKP